MSRLENKVVIVTGGTAGIGRAAAILFAREGAKVSIAARGEEEGAAVADMITREGGDAIFVRTDVTCPDDCEALVAKTVSEYGRLDLAFNNAGANPAEFLPVADLSIEEWRRVIDLNLTSVFLCMKYQIPEMLKVGGGAIVNTSGIGGLVGFEMMSHCLSSKHGVIGLTKVAALDYAKQNIRVNAVCPGVTLTDFIGKWFEEAPETGERLLAMDPMGRFAQPIEQAEAALFLLSDKASHITGVALPVDGGYVAR